MGRRIEVLIDEEGNCEIEAFGYTGGECTEATKELEESLGSRVNRRMKRESQAGTQTRTVDRNA